MVSWGKISFASNNIVCDKALGERVEKIEWRFESNTGLGEIYAEIWTPDEKPKAVIQIVHGMAEHIGRYSEFASFLIKQGFAVFMNDHPGHGKSIQQEKHKGYFGDRDGWKNVIKDMKVLHDRASDLLPGVPIILFGHSMGSFFARAYAMLYPKDNAAYIFSGTAGRNPLIGLGRSAAKFERLKNGPMKASRLLQKLSTGAYNKKFAREGLANTYLSSVEAVSTAYKNDPLCGFAFTAEAMLDLCKVMKRITGKQWADKVSDVPIYLFWGELDPVGAYGKGPRQVVNWLADTKHTQVEYRPYQAGRHEMLNEKNKEEVYEHIIQFIKYKVL